MNVVFSRRPNQNSMVRGFRMVRHARLCLSPASITATVFLAGLLAALCILVLPVIPAGAAGTSQGPVAEYSFDEDLGEGTTVKDLSGDGNTATIEGAEWSQHGKYGGGMRFDPAKEARLSVPASEDLDLDEEFTLEAWVRPEGEQEEYATIFGKENSVSPHFAYIAYAHTPYNAPEVFFDESAAHHLGGAGGTPVPDTWTHIALTDDGAHSRLYVNGQLVDTAEAVPIPSTDGDLVIGGNKAFAAFFKGRLDEVRVYNRALDGTEVGADMETPIQTPKAGPVAEYSFDEDPGEGTTIEDQSGDENTATIEGAAWSPHGRYGGAMSFGGEGQTLSVPASPELDPNEEFTVEAWVHPESNPAIENLLEKENSGEPTYGYLLTDQHGQLGAYFQEESGYTRYSPGEGLEPHVWTHVALVYDGARVHLFIDGAEVESGPAPSFAETDGALVIGGGGGLGGNSFDGRIDEVRVYDRALNTAEVAGDMEAPIQTQRSGPLAAYAFDEGEEAGESAEDVSGNEHTATIEDGTRTKGRYGGAVEFSGLGGTECVTVPDALDLRVSEEFTLEAWVRPDNGVYGDPVVVRESGGKNAFGLGLGLGSEGEETAGGFIGHGKGTETAGGGIVHEKTWSHVATTYDGRYIRVYVDGELVDTEEATTPPLAGEGNLKIGCDGPDGQFTGRIDEVRFYGRALNPAEVAYDMEAPLQTQKATPVADYSFDEKNEEAQADTSGDGHTATVEGAEWTEHGRYGGAMEFKASKEDVLKIPASADLNFKEEFTLEAWVRPSGASNKYAPLIDKQEGGSLGYFLYEGSSESDVPVGAADPEHEHVHAHEPLPADTWSHVALVFVGNRTFLYVNGVEVQNGAALPVLGEEGELEIGGSTDTADYFDGRIDEVRIYNRGLNPAEVAADMEAPIQPPKHGPIAAWSFEEGEGTTVEDVTGDEHGATIEGATWARGKYGGALQFDGEDDCVSVAESEDLRLDEEFSIEAWVRPDAGSPAQEPIIVQEDEAATEGEEPYAYALVGGGEASAAGRVRITGEHQYEGIYGDGPLPEGAWTHILLTDDGAHLRLFEEGELVREAAAPILTTARGQISIGCNKVLGAYFQGRIDEVRIYGRALGATETVDVHAPRFAKRFQGYASETKGTESTEIFFEGAEDPTLPNGDPGSGIDVYRYRTSVDGATYTGWEESSTPYFGLAGVHEGDEISIQLTLRDHVWNESGIYESTMIAPLAGPLSPGEYSPEEGVPGAPGGSCAAEPQRADCPTVERIVVLPPSDADETPYGPISSPKRAGEASPQVVPAGHKCGVHASVPNVTLFKDAHTEARNECLTGQGVTYTELFISLYKEQEDGEQQFRGYSMTGRRTGAGLTTKNHYSECHGTGRLDNFAWTSEAQAYTDIEGVMFVGVNEKVGELRCN
jgi:hypothetical protein